VHLVELRTHGFRNLPAVVPIAEPVAVVVGENNAGKSNLIDAMRSTLRPLHSYREQHEITIDDFAADPASGEPITAELAVELVFDGLDQHARGRMLTCLSADGRAVLGTRAELTEAGRVRTTMFSGDAKLDEPDLLARSAVTFTYLHPLRNAEADLRPGRSNRLVALLRALAPDADQEKIVEIAQQANEELAKVASIVSARDDIQARLDRILGLAYGQKVDLLFADPAFERVVGTMRAAAGDLAAHDLDRNGLGYNNLLYIATLLAGLEQEKDAELHLLLIEEPEAHLHPQLQDLLMRYVETAASSRVQVVVTTHSPNLASTPSIERITVLARERREGPVLARAINEFGLDPNDVAHLHRFLDVTKASLLFARGVLLVEGVAEQLVVPAIAQQMNKPLAQHGIAVVNIGGLAFRPFAALFGPDRLPYRCALLTDSDPPEDEPEAEDERGAEEEHATATPEEPSPSPEEVAAPVVGDAGDTVGDSNGGAAPLSAASTALSALENENVRVFRSEKTFEWDLVKAGNWDVAVDAVEAQFKRVAARLRKQASDDESARASLFLAAVERRKGVIAQELLALVASGRELKAPSYIEHAIMWLTEEPPEDGTPAVEQPGFS
jgi:putative ATP-dependent endonuclease of the OLD family